MSDALWIFEIKIKYEYYSAIKHKEILPFMATWINVEVINQSEISQTEKDRNCRSSLKCGIKKKKKKTQKTHRKRDQPCGKSSNQKETSFSFFLAFFYYIYMTC